MEPDKQLGSDRGVYTRAILVIVMPVGLVMAFTTQAGEATYFFIASHIIYKWLALFLLVIVVSIELLWIGIFTQLLLARGNISAYHKRRLDPARIARKRRRKFRFAAASLSFLLALLIAELVFRVFDIRPTPNPPPQYIQAERVNNHRNALGLREDWDTLADRDQSIRIMMLGDSVTYGESVEPNETFCHLVEDNLNSQPNVLPKGVITINLGVPGTAPGEQLKHYLSLKDRLHPQIVLHILYINDLSIDLYAMLRQIYRIRDDELIVGDASYVLYYLEKQIRYWLAWHATIDYFRGGRNNPQRAAAWTVLKTDVRACKQAVEESGSVYAIVMFPWLFQLDDYLLTDVHRDMGLFATELGVPYLDLLKVFAGRDADSLRIGPANEHPNAEGHRLAAQKIAWFIRQDILPKLSGQVDLDQMVIPRPLPR